MEARRARVRPRVVADGGSEAIAVDALLSELPREKGQILCIVGGPGWGKTSALEHLRALVGDEIGFFDEPSAEEVVHAAAFGPVVFTAKKRWSHLLAGVWELGEWGSDEVIEYALAVNRERAPGVLRRALPMMERDALGGSPGVWAAVLDVMFADERIACLDEVVERALSGESAADRAALEEACLEAVISGAGAPDPVHVTADACRLIAHEAVRVMLAAWRVARELEEGGRCAWLARRLPREFVAGCAPGLGARARENLCAVLEGRSWEPQPMAASLLHASGGVVLGPGRRLPVLAGAYLEGLRARGERLVKLRGAGALLAGADFGRSDLSHAELVRADLTRASFGGGRLVGANLQRGLLVGADVAGVEGTGIDLSHANAEGADFEGAVLARGKFIETVLRSVRLVRADLSDTDLYRTVLDEADCSGARFDGAHLQQLDLRSAVLTGACFRGAMFDRCDLCGQELPVADFQGAVLEGCDLSGTVMPNANFAGALFPAAGLADIHWERANLRGSDLRGCTFHMGSSRSGLVFSPIASEGTRTGFYTEDIGDLTHKAPEEIRKANLRGADLRGCLLDGVDFYLVDLRGALYDASAGPWMRKCGAILEEPR